MRKINAKFNASFISEAGGYITNKDYYACAEMDDFAIYAMADGIDEDIDLNSAQIVVTSVIRQFTQKPTMKKNQLRDYIKTANNELLRQNRTIRLKASIIIAVTDYVNLICVQTGNARMLLFREGSLFYQSMDQSLANTLYTEEKIPADKVAIHQERHNLYQYLGQPIGFNPKISDKIKLCDGDAIMLFTRGIWENVDTGELTEVAQNSKTPQEVLDTIEDLLLSRQPQNLDNYSLAAIFIDKVYEDPAPAKRKALLKKIFVASIPFLIILLIIGIVYYIRQERKKDALETMAGHIANAAMLIKEDNFVRAGEEYKSALDIARKYKLPNEQKDLTNYSNTIGLIITADGAFQQKELLTAAEKYALAQESSYYADYLGADYINRQQRLTSGYMKVSELLQTGNEQVEKKEYDEAKKSYLEARKVATSIYFTEGRKEANEKLAELGVETLEEDKKIKGEEAESFEQKGDTLTQYLNYDEAVVAYKIAAGLFEKIEKPDKVASIQKKIAALDENIKKEQKISEQKSLATEAERYELEGDALDPTDYPGAISKYSLAFSVYNDAGKVERATIVQKKMDVMLERKKNQDKYELQQKGVEMERQGDIEAAQFSFTAAKNSYIVAQEVYSTAGLSTNAAIVQKKIDALDAKVTEFELKKNKANTYLAEADAKTKEGNYVSAKYLYSLAREIYVNLNLKEETKTIDERLKTLNKLSKGKV